MRITPAVLSLGLIIASWAKGPVDVTVTPAIRQYCHIVRFPQGWIIMPWVKMGDPLGTVRPLGYFYDSGYEFRVVGVLGTRFLVRGVVKLGDNYYTKNIYKLDMSDPAGIAESASDQEWQDGTVVPDTRLVDYSRNFAFIRFKNDQPLRFLGLQFRKSGERWEGEGARLSPDRTWIVLLSSSGSVAKRDEFLIFGGRDKGKLFLDIYNVDTGKKLFTIVGAYVDINPQAIDQGLWVTERYFILPLGAHRERCLVCDFDRANRNAGLKQ